MRLRTYARVLAGVPARLAVVGALALALPALTVACGGGGASTTPTAAPTAAATAATTAAVTPTTSSASASGAAAGAAAGAALTFCNDWGTMASRAGDVTGALSSGSATTMKDDIEQTTAFFQSLSDHVPTEIQPDMKTYAQFWSTFAAAMQQANYDITKIATDPQLQASFQAMNDPKLQEATQHIDDWIQQHCGG